MGKKPLIGITLDAEEPGGFSKFPWYALKENYCSSIAEAGGIPFPLTHDLSLIESYLSLINGLVLTGGDFDIDPLIYGDLVRHPTVKVKPKRTSFELAITRECLKKDLPVLGICGGHQVINVALGGTLIQHIPDEIPEGLEHVQPNSRSEPWHTVTIKKDSKLYQITGVEELRVNSGHHQAIKDVAKDLMINAVAPDGIIEGVEHPQYRFCMGFQWHPEFTITTQDAAIFTSFIKEAARG